MSRAFLPRRGDARTVRPAHTAGSMPSEADTAGPRSVPVRSRRAPVTHTRRNLRARFICFWSPESTVIHRRRKARSAQPRREGRRVPLVAARAGLVRVLPSPLLSSPSPYPRAAARPARHARRRSMPPRPLVTVSMPFFSQVGCSAGFDERGEMRATSFASTLRRRHSYVRMSSPRAAWKTSARREHPAERVFFPLQLEHSCVVLAGDALTSAREIHKTTPF